jgi:hypothetical protein
MTDRNTAISVLKGIVEKKSEENGAQDRNGRHICHVV